MSLAVGASPSINLPTKQTTSPEPIKAQNKVSPEEIKWAMAIENKSVGREHTPEEIAKYQDIAQRLQTFGEEKPSDNHSFDTTVSNKYAEPKAATNVGFVDSTASTTKIEAVNQASAKEMKWALDLQDKIGTGYSPSKNEVAKYNEIFNKSQTPVDPKSIGEIGKKVKDGVINAGKAALKTLKSDSAVHHAIGGAAVGAVVGGPVGAAVGATVSFAFSKVFDMFKSKGPIGSAFNTNATESQKKSISFTAAGAALGSVAGPGGALFGGSLGFLASKIKMPEKH